ncbi:sulfatase [Planctomycetales bacterium ZRK34]|nr:sulfatase [Planctomycetales bacterium ZRK34]
MRTIIWFISVLAFCSLAAAGKPNVLFIAVDDLRPEFNAYGATHIHSPNLDRLAARGLVFDRAYCQQAVCNPSRASLMSGRRPDTIRVWDLQTDMRHHIPDLVTIPQQFAKHGYHTERLGKIYHMGHGVGDDKASWTRRVNYKLAPRKDPESQKAYQKQRAELKAAGRDASRARGVPFAHPDCADNELFDGAMTDQAIKLLGELKDKPFFLAVGYLNPHLPFIAPKKYWNMYDHAAIKVPPKTEPDGITPYSLTNWGELRAYVDIPRKGSLDEAKSRNLIHGYYAAVSYVDAQVGRLLDALDKQGLADNTIVILWGDHGWKLGEYGSWCKHTNMELDTHVPLLISAPGMKAAGKHSKALVEFVDIYPSLCELAGVPIPDGLDGRSFAPLLNDPDHPWKSSAFSQYPRGKVMGYSMRTERYHFVRWVNRGDALGEALAVEVYDHQADPLEMNNLAADGQNSTLVKKLTEQYKRELPPASR